MPPPEEPSRALLRAISAGHIRRGGHGGPRASYQIDDVDVGTQLRALHRRGLVALPLEGAARFTEEGEAELARTPKP